MTLNWCEGHYTVNSEMCEIFIFAKSIKRHICDVNNSQLGHDLPSSVNNRMILPFREGFIFTKLCIFVTYSRKFPNLQYTRRKTIVLCLH